MDDRHLKWRVIIYPDNFPPLVNLYNWEQYINDNLGGVAWCHSPLHDKDFKSDGTPDKIHFHCIFDFGKSKKSEKYVIDMLSIFDIPKPLPCENFNLAVQYFIHLNDKDKFQYSKNDIYAYSLNIDKCFQLNEDDALLILLDYINEFSLYDFFELVNNVRSDRPDLLKCLKSNTYFINTYIRSVKTHFSDEN